MSMRLLPKEPIMLRDTSAQDRVIEPKNPFKRHRKLIVAGAIASAVRQSRALFRQSQANYEAAKRNTETQTRAAFRGIVTGIQRIAAARRAVDSGERAVEAMRRNVEFGTGTEFELLDAQNNYYAARRAYAQARYDYLTNVLTLKQQAGRLTEQDLVAIDNLLIEKAT